MFDDVLIVYTAGLLTLVGGVLGHISQCSHNDYASSVHRLGPLPRAIHTIHFHLKLPVMASIMCVVGIYNTFFKQTTFEENKSYLATARNSSPSKNSSEFYCKGLWSIEKPFNIPIIINCS